MSRRRWRRRVADERSARGLHRDGGGLLPGEPDERDVVERGNQPVADDGVDGQARFGGELVTLIADSVSARSGTSTSARKPSLPRFTPRTGERCRSASRIAPASCRRRPGCTRSARRRSSSAVTASAVQASLLTSVSMPRTSMFRWAAESRIDPTAPLQSRSGAAPCGRRACQREPMARGRSPRAYPSRFCMASSYRRIRPGVRRAAGLA